MHAAAPCIEADGRVHTYEQLLAEMARWAQHFDARALEPAAVIALRADYSFAAIAALLAMIERNSVAALLPRDREVTYYLSDACATELIEFDGPQSYRWSAVPDASTHPLLDRLRAAREGGVVIFTSGSTGHPKAALHRSESLLHKFCKPLRPLRTLAFLRLDHIAGLDTLLYTLGGGGTLILTERRDPHSILQLIESCRVEVLPTSPSFLRLLCAAADVHAYDLSSLRVVTYGSETMDASTLARLNALFPHAQISQKYGTTETGSPRSVSRGNDSLWLRIKSDDVETKVVDGVLWIRGTGTILGYLNSPSPFDEAGWYCTGDLVDVDGDWIRFRGRLAEIINVGGEKVMPAEVEQIILELDLVRGALVCGQKHPLLGEIVTARVNLAPRAPGRADAIRLIRSHCRRRLASFKVPVVISIAEHSLVNDRQKALRNDARD